MRAHLRSSMLSLALCAGLCAPLALAEGGGPPPPPPGDSGFVNGGVTPPPGAQPISAQPGAPPGAVVAQPGQSQGQRFAENRRGLFTHVQLGAALPQLGPLSQSGAPGFWANAAAGWEIPNGLAGFLELGIRYHSGTFPAGWSTRGPGFNFLDIPIGVGGRWTPFRENIIHPYVEASLLLHVLFVAPSGFVSSGGGGGGGSTSSDSQATLTFGAAATLGLELDLAESFSLELGARLDYILSSGVWSARTSISDTNAQNDLVVTPFVGGTYYY